MHDRIDLQVQVALGSSQRVPVIVEGGGVLDVGCLHKRASNDMRLCDVNPWPG